MEKELNKDYKKIIKFVNELHNDLKYKKVNTKLLSIVLSSYNYLYLVYNQCIL